MVFPLNTQNASLSLMPYCYIVFLYVFDSLWPTTGYHKMYNDIFGWYIHCHAHYWRAAKNNSMVFSSGVIIKCHVVKSQSIWSIWHCRQMQLPFLLSMKNKNLVRGLQ